MAALVLNGLRIDTHFADIHGFIWRTMRVKNALQFAFSPCPAKVKQLCPSIIGLLFSKHNTSNVLQREVGIHEIKI